MTEFHEIIIDENESKISIFSKLSKSPESIIMVEIGNTERVFMRNKNVCNWLGMVVRHDNNFVLNETSFVSSDFGIGNHMCYNMVDNITAADLIKYINKIQNGLISRYCRFFLINNLIELRDFLVEKTQP
jgi:hypothetical protein